MTQAVLVSKEDEASLNNLKAYTDDVSKFDKIIVDLTNAAITLPEMKEQGYKAATLYIPSNLTVEQNEKYDSFIKDAKRYFRVFFVIKDEGKIVKVKVN
jgi:hypothetical protein